MDQGVTVSSPSNIAIQKYWGKVPHQDQIPVGPSVSMTLDACRSTTTVQRLERGAGVRVIQGSNALRAEDPFAKKIEAHVLRLARHFDQDRDVLITTQNNFPSDAGIASSASGLSALTIACSALWTETRDFNEMASRGLTRNDLANLSRLGSGSAGRSVWGGWVEWQRDMETNQTFFRQIFDQEHFPLADIIVVLDSSPKKTSSSSGHILAHTSPLHRVWQAEANALNKKLVQAIKEKNFNDFGLIAEHEALLMHSVMMTQDPQLHYLSEKTYHLLTWIRNQRNIDSEFNAYFTLDAGPNIHVLCEPKSSDYVHAKFEECFDTKQMIHDHCGNGPRFET